MLKSGTCRGGTLKSAHFSHRLTGVTESHEPEQNRLPADTPGNETFDNPADNGGNSATTKIPASEMRTSRSGKHTAEGEPDPIEPLPEPDISKAVPVGGASTPDRLVGSTIDSRYVIEARIARGGMATVYRAKDTRLDRPVALKIMYPHLAESQDFVARFRREARAAAKLTNPGVVAVYDQGTTDGSSYLVMELVQGPNLRTYLRSQGCLTLGEALKITKEIFDALAAAHRSGLVHRDVKPENVLIPQSGAVKVADFGLARAASEVTAATTGSILGTVAYLAPETVSGETADARVDVYATGIMLYELLAGTPPFTGDTPIQVAYAHVHNDTPRIRQAEPWVPEAVEELIAKLTERDPARRPVDAAAGGALVEEVLANLSEEELALRGTAEPTLADSEQLVAVMPTPTLNQVPIQSPESSRKGLFGRKSRDKELGVVSTTETAVKSGGHGKLIAAISVLVVLLCALVGVWFFLWGPGSYRPMVDVTNQQWSDASKTLKEKEINFERVDAFDDEVPAGNVARTEPAPGKPLGRFQKATVFVSKGIEMLQMPDLSGKNAQEATDLVTKARFAAPQVSEDFSDTIPQGVVASQDPAAGATIPHNTPVKIVISKGREPVTVPQITGKPRDEASTLLSQAGLTPQPSEDYSDTVPKGVVISQSTKAGATAYRHDAVSFVVSKGPQTVAVPNVQRKSQADATAILHGAGLKVRVERIFNVAGMVADTNPRAGTIVPVGSTVTIRMI